MSTKKQVLDMINKRASRIKDIKKKSKRTNTATDLVVSFLDELESIYNTVKSVDEFKHMVEIAAKGLDNQMRILDRGVKMEVQWTDAEDWKDLKVTGVLVNWSSYYQKVHGVGACEYIDSTSLLFTNNED